MKKLEMGLIRDDVRAVLVVFENLEAVRRVGVFGSVARGDHGEDSDIDLVIEYEYADDVFRDAVYYCDLSESLIDLFEQQYGVRIDIVEYKALEKGDFRLKAEVEKDVVWIYEAIE